MSNILQDYFTEIANAIRQRTGEEELLKVQNFSNIIRNIDLGVVLPEFISVTLEGDCILRWTVSDNYMLERYTHNTFFRIDFNNETIITQGNSLDLSPYVSTSMPNIAVISILEEFVGKESWEIHIDYVPQDEIIELPYTTIYGNYSYGFADNYVYTVSDTTNASSTSKTVKRQNNLTEYLKDLADSIRYQQNTEDKIKPINFANDVVNLPQGLKAPKVVNLTAENAVISWDVVGVEELAVYNPEITYIIEINNKIVETTNRYYNLSSLLKKDQENTARIKVKVTLTNPDKEERKAPSWTFRKVDYIDNFGTNWTPAWYQNRLYKVGSNTSNDKVKYIDLHTGEVTTTNITITYTNGWVRLVTGSSVQTVGDKLYRIGGLGGDSRRFGLILGYSYLDVGGGSFVGYNANNSYWWIPSSAVIGDDIYVFGANNMNSGMSNAIYKIHVPDNSYSRCNAVLPGSGSSTYPKDYITAVYNNKIYLLAIGDAPNFNKIGRNVYEYNPINDTLTKLDTQLSDDIIDSSWDPGVMFKNKLYTFNIKNNNLEIKEVNMDTFEVNLLLTVPSSQIETFGTFDTNALYASEEDDCIYCIMRGRVYRLGYN